MVPFQGHYLLKYILVVSPEDMTTVSIAMLITHSSMCHDDTWPVDAIFKYNLDISACMSQKLSQHKQDKYEIFIIGYWRGTGHKNLIL